MPSALNAPSTVVYSPRPVPTGYVCSLPPVFLDTRYDPGGVPLSFVSDITLSANASTTDLQVAIDQAAVRSGHSRIKCPSSVRYEGIVRWTPKGGPYWTYLEWTGLAGLPEGTQVSPSVMANAPLLRVTVTNRGIVETAPGANYYRITGFKFDATAIMQTGIVYWQATDSSGDVSVSAVADQPDHLIMDRCWIHGSDNGTIKNGLVMNTATGACVDTYIDNIWYDGVESHCVAAYSTLGPLKLVGNHFGGATINVLTGGTNPYFTGLIATDVEMRRNYFSKPYAWNPYHPLYQGVPHNPIKNNLEFKCGSRMLAEGNYFENSWEGGQTGTLVGIKNLGGETGNTMPWFVTNDLLFRNNILDHSFDAFYLIGGNDSTENAGGVNRIVVYGNIMKNMAHRYARASSSVNQARVAQLGSSAPTHEDIAIAHNTMLPALDQINELRYVHVFTSSADIVRFQYKDNLTYSGFYPNESSGDPFTFRGAGAQNPVAPYDGEACLAAFAPGATVAGNVIIKTNAATYFPSGGVAAPVSVAAVDMVDPANGNFRLKNTSPYKNTASDGTDPGANQDDVELATLGVATGTGGGAFNTAPVAAITNPASGSTVNSGASVSLQGTGSDFEDGSLTGASLAWTSSINGALGAGSPLVTSSLSVGTHTITLTATDSGNLTDTDTITLTVSASTIKVGSATIPITSTVTSFANADKVGRVDI